MKTIYCKNNKKQKGFTLVELSIAIAIIGILLGLSLQGMKMLEEAKLKTAIAEVDKFKVAINSFKIKYDSLPGDADFAENYWGIYADPGNLAGTQNGDADGQIEYKNSADVFEGFRAWQHLSYARMLDGAYIGSQDDASAASIGIDIPEAQIGGGYHFDYSVYGLTSKNVLVLGRPVTTAASPVLASGILQPKDAHFIDSKADDGIPAKGAIRGTEGNGSAANTCINANNVYADNLEASDCILVFRLDTE